MLVHTWYIYRVCILSLSGKFFFLLVVLKLKESNKQGKVKNKIIFINFIFINFINFSPENNVYS